MRILVTNDDGINAQGLTVLEEIAHELSDDVWVVAPETNQSGSAHSLTIHEPLRCREVAERKFAIRGTPTDCVIMGVRHILLNTPPDLVLSGVNHGSNLAEDVTYSGTVAGAMEGAMLGIPSIAMSLTCGFDKNGDIHWDTPRSHGPELIRRLLKNQLPAGVLINVNYPDLPPDEVSGMMITTQGHRDQNLLNIDERLDPWGRSYFWFGFERRLSHPVEGSDLWAIANGLISVTPLHADLTHAAAHAALTGIFSDTRSKPRKLG
ncbi:broad specificity 5'(3')-nucleotidase and polyphosphatase [Candidatus Filomicrobium marinum]|uniref:5'-nucleotidase SurE n=2 Tax=Filomicrobium TaxID=119044 RepID=A0A0D6JHI5_9HYPH|nr:MULTISPECIES: 5'/3'-nucleotidase SurE [Filomicrobium]MCV0369704.1 5'/3'-nucleotidase SurE [Filomicrobium sp.]CFX48288.1 broad specificity 5'(3')-nucleotidase and polyphosphatase [Candidatus Filomicrobium marinum]CPR20442.1 broad specificity 5'(3')-nucleotidase and polyphosphatase [Candidatus Filomicrobium marinum]SDP15157.1 5'-nucleotidase /3'-nucleotidase /exopolyphosphatase [Filomicrobium insigne]